MGRKKKDVDDAFFAEFDTMDEDGNVKEPAAAEVAPGNSSGRCWDIAVFRVSWADDVLHFDVCLAGLYHCMPLLP